MTTRTILDSTPVTISGNEDGTEVLLALRQRDAKIISRLGAGEPCPAHAVEGETVFLTSAAASAALEFHVNELPQVEAEFLSRINQDLEAIKMGVKRAVQSYEAKLAHNSSELTKSRYLFRLADFFACLDGKKHISLS